MSSVAAAIIGPATIARGYAAGLLKGVSPDRAARKPEGINANHPAWVLGHVAIYHDHLLGMLGREDLAAAREGWAKLFDHDSECRDDPDGSIYPPLEEIAARFNERTDTLLGVLAESDGALAAPNTWIYPDTLRSVGDLMNFMLVAHVMMHLGQVSTWRRAMGLGSVF